MTEPATRTEPNGETPDRPEPGNPRLSLRPLADDNRDAVVEFAVAQAGRRPSDPVIRWRYHECPTLEAVTVMAAQRCVATMFGLERRYMTPDGPRQVLEPFEWHASEEWRAQAPGLRVVKHLMKGDRPMLASAGTDAAAGLLRRLKWTHVADATRYALPLSGRYLASRGRSAAVSRAFDRLGRFLLEPSAPRRGALVLEPAGRTAPSVARLVERQRRFSLMRFPDEPVTRWLDRAPAAVGHYLTFHAKLDGRLVGWVGTRLFQRGPVFVGELLEVFLEDGARSHYRELVRRASATLVGFRVDALLATTTCPDTAAALSWLRFRRDDSRPVFAWWGSASPPAGRVLVDGTIADHAFFPLPSGRDSAWIE